MSSSRLAVWISSLFAVALVVAVVAWTVTSRRGHPGDQQKIGRPAKPSTAGAGPIGGAERDNLIAEGKQLYDNYCAACHGPEGDGNGPAARYLYPKPRNFRANKFRIVSTVNRVPSDQDLRHVIDRGMPGSAMFPFAHLQLAERDALVAYIRHLTFQGVADRFRETAREFGEPVDETELDADVKRLTMPGDVIDIPSDLALSDAASLAQGRELYMKQCATCHGESGRGDGVDKQFDDDGLPTRPRDYTRGIFKGGREFQQLYARIVLGMPGTPMPASPNLPPQQIGQLCRFIQSLSDPAAQEKVEHKRMVVPVKRTESLLIGAMNESAWQEVPAVRIVVSPLWWRDYTEPDLHVQAVHDGQTIAIRMTWNDVTQNGAAVRAQDFEDMAALQLFQGAREPFLGMGAEHGLVDVWLWRAGWQTDLVARADVNTAYPNMAVDLYPFEQHPDETPGHATKNQAPAFLAALAAGNSQAELERSSAGAGLQAKGFGTLTMLPKISQVVQANGAWNNGQWRVVLTRHLAVDPQSGLKLAAGDTVSVAFAIWDGAAKDRNGQKLVSIWHDLELQ